MRGFSETDINKIHDASMETLRDVGVAFYDSEAIDHFKKKGFKVDGAVVFFEEEQVMKALETAPSQFVIHARNPEKNVRVGREDFALMPGWGAPYIIDREGEQRDAVMEDYNTFCKLVHTSDCLDMTGFLMVMPSDIHPGKAHLNMLLSNILLSDKAFMGSPQDKNKAIDSIEMACILWGGEENIRNKPVLPSKISPVSPLMYSEEMAGSLIQYARLGQPLEFPDVFLAGTTAPITLAGATTVMNAECLAGIVLVQLINPGTPCIYGGHSCATDMRTGGMALGGPEAIQIVSIIAQLADFYKIPCKGGGNLTDSFFPDMQAGVESALGILTALAGGVHFLNQACGILAGFNAMSFEKFMIDEETCAAVRRIIKPVEVTDETIALDQIKRAGVGGAYITFSETFKKCRTEVFTPAIATRGSYEDWKADGKKRAWEKARDALKRRLDSYVEPDIDPSLKKDLLRYVEKKSA